MVQILYHVGMPLDKCCVRASAAEIRARVLLFTFSLACHRQGAKRPRGEGHALCLISRLR